MGCGLSSAKESTNAISPSSSKEEKYPNSSSAVKGAQTVNSRKPINTLQLQTVTESSATSEEDAAFKTNEVVAGRRLSQSHSHATRNYPTSRLNAETAPSSTYHSTSSVNSHRSGNSDKVCLFIS